MTLFFFLRLGWACLALWAVDVMDHGWLLVEAGESNTVFLKWRGWGEIHTPYSAVQ